MKGVGMYGMIAMIIFLLFVLHTLGYLPTDFAQVPGTIVDVGVLPAGPPPAGMVSP